MCSEFPSREKSGGVGVDSHLCRKSSSPTDLKIDFGASYIPFAPEELYSSVLGITTQHRPDNDQVKYKYSKNPFFVKCPLYLGNSKIEMTLSVQLSHLWLSHMEGKKVLQPLVLLLQLVQLLLRQLLDGLLTGQEQGRVAQLGKLLGQAGLVD